MKQIILSLILSLALLAGCIEKRTQPPITRESAVTGELLAMVEEDQQVRYNDSLDAAAVAAVDRTHRDRIFELLAAGEITEPKNLFNAALILEHADPATCVECYLLAHRLASVAVNRGFEEARSLAAATLDRYLVMTGHPQKYGTQIGVDSFGNSYLYTVDSLTTDSMRRLWDVPSLDSLKARVEALSRGKDLQ